MSFRTVAELPTWRSFLDLSVYNMESGFMLFPPQTVFTLKGFWQIVVSESACAPASVPPPGDQLLCTGCGLGETHLHPSQLKPSLFLFTTAKHNGFDTRLPQDVSGPLEAQGSVPGVTRCIPDTSKMLSRASEPPDTSPQMQPRCLPDASKCLPDAS
jgi:hypothetical protein